MPSASKADDGPHGRALFVSDGSEEGTVMLKDIRPGVSSGAPAFMTVLTLLLPGLLGKTSPATRKTSDSSSSPRTTRVCSPAGGTP